VDGRAGDAGDRRTARTRSGGSLLVAWEGLSTAETAVVLGCSRAAAKVRLHRARRKLRRKLDELDERTAHAIAAAPAALEEAL
jgi:hypothetical protein